LLPIYFKELPEHRISENYQNVSLFNYHASDISYEPFFSSEIWSFLNWEISLSIFLKVSSTPYTIKEALNRKEAVIIATIPS